MTLDIRIFNRTTKAIFEESYANSQREAYETRVKHWRAEDGFEVLHPVVLSSERLARLDDDPSTRGAVEAIRSHLAQVIHHLYQIDHEWTDNQLGGDFWTAETSYPFPLSLDEFTAEVEKWHERIGFELEGGISADEAETYAPIFPDLPVLTD